MTSFTVNGQAVRYRLPPETPLLWALRDASNLTGAKYGCGTGACGACTVHVDGRAARSCLVPIGALEGVEVGTNDALNPGGAHSVQHAWLVEYVTQCGHCEPGMIMAAAALVGANAQPPDADIDGAIDHHCPCGIHPRARRAVRRAVTLRAALGPPAPRPAGSAAGQAEQGNVEP